MPFPFNELETVLIAVSRGETGTDSFLTKLFADNAFFPLETSQDGSGAMRVLTIDNRSYVALFTSHEVAEAAAPGSSLAEGPVRELLQAIPAHLGVAVNPGGELGVPVFAETVQRYLTGSSTLSVGTRVRVGEPSVEPTELLSAISLALDEVEAVRGARRCWAQIGDAAPGLVLGLDLDPDNPDSRAAAISAIGRVTGHSPEDFPVDIVFAAQRDPFIEWMNANAEPFYRAT